MTYILIVLASFSFNTYSNVQSTNLVSPQHIEFSTKSKCEDALYKLYVASNKKISGICVPK